MNQINIQEYKIRREVPPKLEKQHRVAVDTEFINMQEGKLHRPTGEFACAAFYFGTDEVFIVENSRDLQLAMDNIQDAGWLFHNAKFDIFHLRRFVRIEPRMKIWDTQLVEQVMFSGLFDEFNLAACCRRHLNMFMEKETREEFSAWSGEMSQKQREYACKDVIATYQLFRWQRENIDQDDERVWKDIELPFLWALLSIGGIRLDADKWLEIAKDNEIKAKSIQEKYGREVVRIGKSGKELKTRGFDGINLGSPKQVKEEFKRLGVDLEGTSEDLVAPLRDDYEFARDLLDFREFQKKASTYGAEYLTKYVEMDGKIYTDYFQIGALSGRNSSRSPNLQNQPRDGGYRDCYIADDGNELVIADWASQEPKFAAYITGDENLIEALNSKEKLYIRIARDALGIEVKKGEPAYNHIKSTILGLFYGMSAKGLSDRIKVSVDDAQSMIDAILRAYPKVGKWIKDSQAQFVNYVTSVAGRKVWLNEYNSGWRRNVLNYPIQSSAADAMKIAAGRLSNRCGNSPIRLFVHDEIVCEVPKDEVDEFMKCMEDVMLKSAEELHPTVHAGVDIGHGRTWASKA